MPDNLRSNICLFHTESEETIIYYNTQIKRGCKYIKESPVLNSVQHSTTLYQTN